MNNKKREIGEEVASSFFEGTPVTTKPLPAVPQPEPTKTPPANAPTAHQIFHKKDPPRIMVTAIKAPTLVTRSNEPNDELAQIRKFKPGAPDSD